MAVCPIPDALTYIPRKTEYKVKRGTEPGPTFPEELKITIPPYNPKK